MPDKVTIICLCIVLLIANILGLEPNFFMALGWFSLILIYLFDIEKRR